MLWVDPTSTETLPTYNSEAHTYEFEVMNDVDFTVHFNAN